MIRLNTKIPGPKSAKVLDKLKKINGGWGVPYPLVQVSKGVKGKGCYCYDLDGNIFLDFASQIASNPLGYNHPVLSAVVKKYAGSGAPVKFAGQDFSVEEHLDLLEELTSISPNGMKTAFVINSGAEAVENATKIVMRNRKKAKFSVSVDGSFHGRTLGALSLHHSNPLHRKGYMLLPNKMLPFNDSAGEVLEGVIKKYGAESVAFVIIEHLQGEGGYRIPSDKMVKGLRSTCKKHGIPYVADEVQSGIGRTGKWWAFEHYGIKPDIFSSAKALQVGAVVANKNVFPGESGAISTTWGGGQILDLALGAKIIEVMKKDKLLSNINRMGSEIKKRLSEIDRFLNVRGRGLMIACDLSSRRVRDDMIIECVRNGLLILGAGEKSIRVIPPYIIGNKEIDEGMVVLEKASKTVCGKGFKHSGKICNYLGCGDSAS